MTTLTTTMATEMLEAIERIEKEAFDRVQDIYAEAAKFPGGSGNVSVLKDALKARAAAREEQSNAAALLESFDANPD